MTKKTKFHVTLLALCCIILALGCKKEPIEDYNEKNETKEQAIRRKLEAAGFNLSQGFQKFKEGYIVEYDIFLTSKEIDGLTKFDYAKVSAEVNLGNNGSSNSFVNPLDPISHYRTDNLVSFASNSRTITVYIDTFFGSYIQNALDIALLRYNDLDLAINFSRVSSSSTANIVIRPESTLPNTTLMMAGFPSGGNPYHEIKVNPSYFNSLINRADAATALAHEIGHCIGLRHTDYMNRAFSCGGVAENEGTTSSGATHIIGTSNGPSENSFMLACSNGFDRPFTTQDIIALLELYPKKRNVYVKEVMDFLYDYSYPTSSTSDHEEIAWDITAEFYDDPSHTIPYSGTKYFLLHIYESKEYSYYPYYSMYPYRLLIQPGQSSYYLGPHISNKDYSYGVIIADNGSGYRIFNGPGYNGPFYP